MPKAEVEKVAAVDPARLFEVIRKYEDYAEFVPGVIATSVDRSHGDARVKYEMDLVKRVTYTCRHFEDPSARTLEWDLEPGSSTMIKKNHGKWTLRGDASACTIRYELEVEFLVPVPSLILSPLIKRSMPQVVDAMIERARRND